MEENLEGMMKRKNKDSYRIYVTVGVPIISVETLSGMSIFCLEKVAVEVDETIEQTAVQAAKLFRKAVADDPKAHGWPLWLNCKPSELYYEIYMNRDAEYPYACSLNSPYEQMK